MENNGYQHYFEKEFKASMDFKEILEKYLKHIKWFILSVIVLVAFAYLKMRFEVPMFDASATILIKEKQKGTSVGDLSSFEDLGIFGKDRSSLENEIHILSSRKLITKVVKELKLNISYSIETNKYNQEQYPDFPIILRTFFNEDELEDEFSPFEPDHLNNLYASILISVISKDKFEYYDSEGNSRGIKKFGDKVKTNIGTLVIDINENRITELIGENIIVDIVPIQKVVDIYMNSILVQSIDEDSNVLRISLRGPVTEKSILIINNLIEQYNIEAIEDKGLVYTKTSDFLNERIELLTTQLTAIETSAEQFKTRKGLVDVQSESGVFLQSSSQTEREVINANTQLQLVNYMIEELNNNSVGLLPGNIGLADATIIALIGEYNNLVLQRNRILKSSTTRNPLIVSIDSQITVLKNNLDSSVLNLKSSIEIQLNSLTRESGRINSRIASVPKNEREYKGIVRQQETKNALYLFLLQKREESEISKSVTVDNARVIDSAYSSGRPVSPKKLITYLAALVLGLFVPFSIIYVADLLDTKVHTERDFMHLKIPYLGDIPLNSEAKDLYVKDGDISKIAEAFRYIRTNINYMLDSKNKGKVVFITSTQSHEGKTFCAINLASSLAISGKKTLLLGMDLRAPKINRYAKLKDIPGVTNFIKDRSIHLSDIIEKNTSVEDLHVINSGDIPPNPVELLMSKRVDEIFDGIRDDYEYIIVDTAPVGMVTDTIQISKYADLTIYVVKANFLDKRMLHIPDKLHKENKLKNMAMLINGSDNRMGAYGYGYGYGNEKEKSWYKKIISPLV